MFLGQASQEAERLEALIQDLLSLARIESGEDPDKVMEDVDLDALEGGGGGVASLDEDL